MVVGKKGEGEGWVVVGKKGGERGGGGRVEW